MIVVDTSAWIELLRGTEHAVRHRLETLIGSEADLAVTEVIVAEILSGARNEKHRDALRDRLLAYPLLLLGGLAGYEGAADLYRSARRRGVTIRSLTDCLIAVPTMNADATLLHNDADFTRLASTCALREEPLTA